LTYDTEGSIFMTYDKVSKFRVGRTYQYSTIFVEKELQQRRSRIGDNGSIWSFQEASIPIHSRGTENKAQDADSRTEGGIYRKASQKPGFSYQTICKFYWGNIKQYSYTSPKGISKKKGAWPRGVVKDRSRCFIVTIGWSIVKFHKFIDYSFQRRRGLSVEINRI
jgi:hypothetical protein